MTGQTHFGLHTLLRSRFGIVLVALLIFAAILIEAEHRVHIFGLLFLLLLSLACLGMHLPDRRTGNGNEDQDDGKTGRQDRGARRI